MGVLGGSGGGGVHDGKFACYVEGVFSKDYNL